jgi:hypothetical protein
MKDDGLHSTTSRPSQLSYTSTYTTRLEALRLSIENYKAWRSCAPEILSTAQHYETYLLTGKAPP